jgi:adenylylsulfate kinase
VWLTGLPRSGKSTIAQELAPLLRMRGCKPVILDREEVERNLGPEVPAAQDTPEPIAHRVSYVAELLVKNGDVPIVAVSNRLASTRARARLRVPRLVEVYVTTPGHVCEVRSPAGASGTSSEGGATGEIRPMEPFETPTSPEIRVGTLDRTPRQSAEWVLRELDRLGLTSS